MTLKELFKSSKKEEIYEFYKRLNNSKVPEYKKITKDAIYKDIISNYKNDPELILKLCNIEEIEILRKLLDGALPTISYSYVDHVVFENLRKNYLIIKEESYYIPDDLINYIKMAMNLFDFKEYSMKDIKDNVILGLVRSSNVIEIEQFLALLENYYIKETKSGLKEYISNSLKLKEKIGIKKKENQEYIVSLEEFYYIDVLNLRTYPLKPIHYQLEELISIGKYKVNLFHDSIFKYLCFLEEHLEPQYTSEILNELILYCGLDINEEETLKAICNHIPELYQKTREVISCFPVWIYEGHSLSKRKYHFTKKK